MTAGVFTSNIESRIDRIHVDPDPNTVTRVFIHPVVVGFTLISPVDIPCNNAFLVTPSGFQIAALFKRGVMLCWITPPRMEPKITGTGERCSAT